MGMKSSTVRILQIGGSWSTIGSTAGASPGVWHESLELDWDNYGPSTATFDLKRRVGTQWPDLLAFSDVEIEVAGTQVWKGRIKGTPANSTDTKISVQCEGMQFHLDDDVYTPFYVKNNFNDFVDMRSAPNATLGSGGNGAFSGADVSTDPTGIRLACPNNTPFNASTFVGVYFDAGPNVLIKAVVATWDAYGSDTSRQLYIRGCSTPDVSGWGSITDFVVSNLTPGPTTSGGTTTGYRYVQIFMFNTAGTYTPTSDVWMRIKDIQLYTDSSYTAGNSSRVRASTIVGDAVTQGTKLLSSDKSQITTTSFFIPDFAKVTPSSPREAIDAANAFHGYKTKVDEQARIVFGPLEAAPRLEVGAWTPMEGEDASANSGEDVYNRALVTGTDVRGAQQVVQRASSSVFPVSDTRPVTDLVHTNPSFDTSTTGWTASVGTLSRTTTAGEFVSTPAAAKIVAGGSPIQVVLSTSAFTGTFTAGVTYVITVLSKMSPSSGVFNLAIGKTGSTGVTALSPMGDSTDFGSLSVAPSANFASYSVVWAPKQSYAGSAVTLVIGSYGGGLGFTSFVDSLSISRSSPTIVDKRGFIRTKVLDLSNTLDTGGLVAAQIGDAFLTSHRYAQFKGSYNITGPIREITTGRDFPPEQIGMRTTDLLRFNDRVDPDTGSWGRDGRIAAVHYSMDNDQASVTIDNTSQNFEALLSRLALLTPAA